MRRRCRRWMIAFAIGTLPLATFVACGSRTDLDDVTPGSDAAAMGSDQTSPAPDSSSRDAATRDATVRDVFAPTDAEADTGIDAPIEIVDAGPPLPGIDASFDPDSGARCVDGGVPSAYLVALSGNFYSFDPATSGFALRATLNCPSTYGPFTMTVAQDAAYVLSFDGNLFKVDLNTFQCEATPFVPAQLGFPGDIGIGTTRSTDGGAEGLLVYGCTYNADGPCFPTLATSDLSAFVLGNPLPVVPPPKNLGYPVDVKDDAFGRVFALDAAGDLISIDVQTGSLLGEDFTGLSAGAGWALLTYEHRLFIFTQDTGMISEWNLTTKTATNLGDVGETIVGASAAPCVP